MKAASGVIARLCLWNQLLCMYLEMNSGVRGGIGDPCKTLPYILKAYFKVVSGTLVSPPLYLKSLLEIALGTLVRHCPIS